MPRIVEAQERREQILRAAVAVFSERGYTQATISDIAAVAGLAHGTIYLYFPSKAAIFETLVGWFAQTLLESFADSAPEGEAHDADSERTRAIDLPTELYQLYFRALATCAAHPRLAELSMQLASSGVSEVAPAFSGFHNELLARMRLRLTRAVEDHEIRAVDPAEMAHILVQLLGAGIQCLLAQGVAANPERVAQSTVDFILFGLAAQTSRNNTDPEKRG